MTEPEDEEKSDLKLTAEKKTDKETGLMPEAGRMIVTKIEPLTKTKYKVYLDRAVRFCAYTRANCRRYRISDGRELS